MIELPLIFVSGVLGATHCIGMCGPFALAIGGARTSWAGALIRQVGYTAGRVFTYGALGATAGFGGDWLARSGPAITNIPALLAIAAGMLLLHQGLRAAGWMPRLILVRRPTHLPAAALGKPSQQPVLAMPPCLARDVLRPFLRQGGLSGAFLAGVFTGLMPCGLLYGMVALASSTHHVVSGAAVMIVFGLGTAPAMMMTGLGGRLLSLASRRRLFALAAWCLILTGVVSLARGVSYLSFGDQPPAGCPLCAE